MLVLLIPNPNPPHNLMRRHPGASLRKAMTGATEAEVMAAAVARAKETGDCPCETEAERLDHIARYNALHPDGPSLAFPPVGPHYVVDDTELPGGSVSTQNDEDYFFDAWEWSD
jgi:hypothetical protein